MAGWVRDRKESMFERALGRSPPACALMGRVAGRRLCRQSWRLGGWVGQKLKHIYEANPQVQVQVEGIRRYMKRGVIGTDSFDVCWGFPRGSIEYPHCACTVHARCQVFEQLLQEMVYGERSCRWYLLGSEALPFPLIGSG